MRIAVFTGALALAMVTSAFAQYRGPQGGPPPGGGAQPHFNNPAPPQQFHQAPQPQPHFNQPNVAPQQRFNPGANHPNVAPQQRFNNPAPAPQFREHAAPPQQQPQNQPPRFQHREEQRENRTPSLEVPTKQHPYMEPHQLPNGQHRVLPPEHPPQHPSGVIHEWRGPVFRSEEHRRRWESHELWRQRFEHEGRERVIEYRGSEQALWYYLPSAPFYIDGVVRYGIVCLPEVGCVYLGDVANLVLADLNSGDGERVARALLYIYQQALAQGLILEIPCVPGVTTCE